MRQFCILSLLLVSQWTFAWGLAGHEGIAVIAEEHLLPPVKIQVLKLVKKFQFADPKYAPTLANAATWPDRIKFHGVHAFDSWHFIDIPFSYDGTKGIKPGKENVVWAINQAEKVLTSANSNNFERAMFLRFLVHFVGDAHQPLHCADFYSKSFKQGARGGNLYQIHTAHFHNLHSAWDDALGSLPYRTKKQNKIPLSKIVAYAQQVEQQFPEKSFSRAELSDLKPYNWAHESYLIAKNFAYKTPMNQKPSKQYQKQGRRIAMRRLALAGYRLAAILNRIFSQPPYSSNSSEA